MRTSRKESELNIAESQIRGVENKLKYARSDKELLEKQLVSLKKELEKFNKVNKLFFYIQFNKELSSCIGKT